MLPTGLPLLANPLQHNRFLLLVGLGDRGSALRIRDKLWLYS